MTLDLTTITPPTPVAKKSRRARGRRLAALAAVAVLGGGTFVWARGSTLRQGWSTPPVALKTLDVVDGPLAVVVVENGTVESASNTTVKCQVEALVGMVGGTSASQSPTQTRAASASTSTSTTAAAPSDNGAGKTAADKATAAKASADKAAKKAMRQAKAAGESTGTSSSSSGTSKSSSSSGSSGSSGSGVAETGGSSKSSSSSSGTSQTTVTKAPSIRSFNYEVKPYTSLQTAKRTTTATTKSSSSSGGGGNRGGGGGGGGGGITEKAGSTRIIMIRDEGASVKAGDIVCEFDAAAFRDAVLAQRIKTDTAKSVMIQAQSILEVNQISLNEYRDGIFQQDMQLVRQYLSTCRTEYERAQRNVAWSQAVLDKNFRAPQQHQAEVFSLQRAEIALKVAELMEQRLQNATGPKIIRSLEAKLQANRADALALEGSYRIEADRLKRLEKMVENCTLKAPHDGTVVYAMPPSNGWRPATPAIMEGATVREGQPIFELPDPKHMRLRAKINESKVSLIQRGQPVSIRVDAFPERQLKGTVADVTLIPAPASGPGSDVKIYFATINLNAGDFEGLRPGLSAEISFLVDNRPEVTQVPIQAVRWVDGVPYTAISTSADRSQYRWKPIEIGSMNANFAEVIRGVGRGDRVVADPYSLPAPAKLDGPADPAPTLQAADPAASPLQG